LLSGLDEVEQSLSLSRQQMSATLMESDVTLSHDVGELQQQLVTHDMLVDSLSSSDAQLQQIQSRVHALDTNITGTFINSLLHNQSFR